MFVHPILSARHLHKDVGCFFSSGVSPFTLQVNVFALYSTTDFLRRDPEYAKGTQIKTISVEVVFKSLNTLNDYISEWL